MTACIVSIALLHFTGDVLLWFVVVRQARKLSRVFRDVRCLAHFCLVTAALLDLGGVFYVISQVPEVAHDRHHVITQYAQNLAGDGVSISRTPEAVVAQVIQSCDGDAVCFVVSPSKTPENARNYSIEHVVHDSNSSFCLHDPDVT